MPLNSRQVQQQVYRTSLPPPNNLLAAIGDSITQLSSNNWPQYNGSSAYTGNAANNYLERLNYYSYACAVSGQQLRYVRNGGQASQWGALIAPRLAGDVLSYLPPGATSQVALSQGAHVTILAGTNDANGNTFNGQTQAASGTSVQQYIRQMVQACWAGGYRPVLNTIPPLGSAFNGTMASGGQANVDKVNAWIRAFADANGLPLVDHHTLLQNSTSTNGYYKNYYSFDNIHPNTLGIKTMGQALANLLTPLVPARYPDLATYPLDAQSLMNDPLFVTLQGGAGTAPFYWSASGNAYTRTAATFTTVAPSGSDIGNWMTLTLSPTGTGTGTGQVQQNDTINATGAAITSGFSAGDTISLACKVKATGIEGPGANGTGPDNYWTVGIQFQNSSGAILFTWYLAWNWQCNFTSPGALSGEAVVPANTAKIVPFASLVVGPFYSSGYYTAVGTAAQTPPYTSTLSIAQFTLRNKSALNAIANAPLAA